MIQSTNNTVKRNIHNLSANIGKKNWCCDLKHSFAFSLQIDELAHVSGLSVVLVFVRYLFQNKTEENLLSKGVVLKLVPFPTTYLQYWVFKVCSIKI
jgi:hypothetical protein